MKVNNKTIDGMLVRKAPKKSVTPPAKKQATKSTLKRAENLARNDGKLTKVNNQEKASVAKSESLATRAAQQKAVAAESFLEPVETLDFGLEKSIEEKKPVKPTGATKTKKARKHHFMLWFLLVVFIVLGGACAAILFWGDSLINKITGGQSGIVELITAVVSDDVELKKDSTGRTNVLLFGTSGYDMGGSNHDGAQLTDSIMVVSFDQSTGDLAMINLPRDLYMGRTCTATGKINEIYWCNNQLGDNEAAGAGALQDKISEILDIKIQYYAHLNWGALVQIVDALGGITVTLDEDVYDDWTRTYIQAGVPTPLNGEQALGLARARHGTSGGDFSRGASQQKILMALQEKAVSKNLMNLTEAVSILNALGDNVRMNFSMDEVKTLVNLGKKLSLSDMRQLPLAPAADDTYYVGTATINDISYVVPSAGNYNYSQIQKYVAKMFSSNPAVREDADILILNGSGETGVAADERRALEELGYQIRDIDDAPEGEYSESYYLFDLTNKNPGTLKELEGRYNTQARKAAELPDGISTQYDFVVIIGGNTK